MNKDRGLLKKPETAESVKEPIAAERNYKDTIFRLIFREGKDLLSLYNAVNDTDYQNPEELQIVTLENAIYMNMKNDLAFIIDCRMNLYEQQASVNPNMPLRDLIYVVKEYQGMLTNRSLYSSRLVKLPAPNFVVFYNGTQHQPERKVMKLSDAYLPPVEEPALELKVLQLNVGDGCNQELKEKCPILMQYSRYVSKVQEYVLVMPLEDAVQRAVDECIREGILADFLLKNRAEAIAVSIFEYDEERELALLRKEEREEGREEGRKEGREEGIKQGIEAFILDNLETGTSEECILEKLMKRFAMTEDAAKEYLKNFTKA